MNEDNPSLDHSHSFRNTFLLFACGTAVLFWELLFIRWFGSCIRIIAYFSNFVLLASFFGLGVGALISQRGKSLEKLLIPGTCLCLLLGPFLGIFGHDNPDNPLEYIWEVPDNNPNLKHVGSFFGYLLKLFPSISAPYWLLLGVSFVAVVFVFLILGQMLGRFFKRLPPLKAYSLEVAGSLIGVGLFGIISFKSFPPTIWFFVGFIILFSIIKLERKTFIASVMFCSISLYICGDFERFFIWSPYYKIQVHDFLKKNTRTGETLSVGKKYGYKLFVNNDYHQLILNLSERKDEEDYFKSWRKLYDYPYRSSPISEEAPILIVGAGTGNDVSAALRNSNALIDIVEIDPEILRIGKTLHPEKPYSNSRVNIINDDARHYFSTTEKKYSKVVFGFLDSHTLLSSFSSVRLDNFVYTQESLQRVREILLPEGEVYLTFATTKVWIHERIIRLLDTTFEQPTQIFYGQDEYSNGIIYMNRKLTEKSKTQDLSQSGVKVPTDNWPFLYLQMPAIPAHYIYFMVLTILLSVASLGLLPAGKRKIELKYFFMGAGFFLIETSNVVKLSILHGSTWLVNVMVFSGILLLILIGNWVSSRMKEDHFSILFGFLLISCMLSYVFEPKLFLVMNEALTRGGVAGLLYLGPIFFASVIFARLIRVEKNFYAVYGSNLLGAMVGGPANTSH
jgi:spermidine synthase